MSRYFPVKTFIAWIVLLYLCCALAWAQVSITTVTTVTCQTAVPAGATAEYDWYGDKGLTLTPIGNGQSATPSGVGTFDGVVVATINGVKIPIVFTVTVGEPGPAPPLPVPALRSLVSDVEAIEIAKFFRGIAGVVTTIADAADFWARFENTFPVKGNAAPDARLKVRINEVIANLPKQLSTELLAIAVEFDAPAPPKPEPPGPIPSVIEGKRQLIIIREAGDMTPEFNSLIVNLQARGPEYEYLRSKGHKVRVYDDEQEQNNEPIPLVERLETLNPLPEAYVLDMQDNVLANRDIDPAGDDATTAAQLTEFVRQNGG